MRVLIHCWWHCEAMQWYCKTLWLLFKKWPLWNSQFQSYVSYVQEEPESLDLCRKTLFVPICSCAIYDAKTIATEADLLGRALSPSLKHRWNHKEGTNSRKLRSYLLTTTCTLWHVRCGVLFLSLSEIKKVEKMRMTQIFQAAINWWMSGQLRSYHPQNRWNMKVEEFRSTSWSRWTQKAPKQVKIMPWQTVYQARPEQTANRYR